MPDSLPPPLLEIAQRLAIAGLLALAVGTEREWSSTVAAAKRRFAGIRTFFLIGLLGGTSGVLMSAGLPLPATVLLAAGAAFVVGAYLMAARRPEQGLDGTTEMAALVVLGLAFLAGLGYLALAAGGVAVVTLALAEKSFLHGLVQKIDEAEMRAGVQFLVLALVVLPLLPTGPYESLWGLRPRALWMIVLLLSGLNFVGYITRQLVGPAKGYGVTGIIGGLVSSTAVTLQFSRLSRAERKQGSGLAIGVIGACTVLPLRVLVVSGVLDLNVAWALVPYLLPPFLVGALLLALGMRYATGDATPADDKSPLRLRSALVMAVAFQLSMFALAFTQARWGSTGLLGSALFLGLTDVDALTVSMSRLATGGELTALAALGIAVGIAANTAVKLGIAATLGAGTFRRWAVAGLGLLLVASGVTIWWGW